MLCQLLQNNFFLVNQQVMATISKVKTSPRIIPHEGDPALTVSSHAVMPHMARTGPVRKVVTVYASIGFWLGTAFTLCVMYKVIGDDYDKSMDE